MQQITRAEPAGTVTLVDARELGTKRRKCPRRQVREELTRDAIDEIDRSFREPSN